MADFALGLTKMAMEGTVSRVKLAIEEEKKLRVRVQNDLVFITGEFEMMQSFLKVANVKGAQNEVVRTWVRQVRDLAFDVEDCVEFVVHLDKKTAWGWLRRFGLMVVSCSAPPLPLDKAVDDITNIKSRVEDVSQRNVRYNLIMDSGSNSKPMSLAEQPARANTGPSAFRILREVWEDMGKCRSMGDLEKLIKSEGSDLQVISVWGSTGAANLGVASILMKAYNNDPEICQEFKTRAWVKLMDPFQPDEFIKSMLTQICARSSQADIGAEFRARMKEAVDMEDDHLKAELMQQLMSRLRYLVILEQVSTVVEWDVIKSYLPDSKNGSRLIVSTNQLQIALLCTGKPYQVSELTRFSDDQSLCVFSKKSGRRSGTSQLIWQMRCRGVTSVWGSAGDVKSTVVHKVYTSIMYKSKQFDGVEFERHSWVDVPDPFNMEVFSRRLLVNFRSQDLQVEEIAGVVGMMRDPGLIEKECCKILRQKDCLVVINGLLSTHDWDVVKAAFLSEPIKGCIIAITNEERVTAHCVDDRDGVVSIKDLETDPVLRALIKGCQYYGIEDKEASRRGRFFSIRREEARDWYKKFGRTFRNHDLVENHVTSLWGTSCARKSDIVRNVYYEQILWSEGYLELEYEDDLSTQRNQERKFKMFSWVYVQHPFNLTNFSWRLLLDFHSDDLQSKRSAAVGIMEGQDPIQECCKFLRKYKCLVVVDGLQSKDDWDSIRAAFLSGPFKGCIIVITSDENVAKYVVSEEQQAFNAKYLEAETVFHPPIKGCAFHVLSNRSEEARDWTNTYTLVGRQARSAYDLGEVLVRYHGVISVWGIAGVGKSTLVRSVFCHSMLGLEQIFQREGGVCSYSLHGFTRYSWVDVPHPFSLTDLCRCLLLDFHSDDIRAKEAAAVGIVQGQDPIQGCRRILHEHRCLVVMDGLRSTDDWDLIKAAFLPDSTTESQSRIVVITNEKRVATHCVDKEDQVVNVKGLNSHSALNLFNKMTQGCKELTPTLSGDIVAKCGGILKVIDAIGKLFAKEITPLGGQSEDMSTAAKELLNDINGDFMGTLERDPKFHCLRGLFAWMQSYFNALSDSLKPCIFYMSVFPGKHNIRRRRLLRRWIAEGYSRDTSDRVAEENGERLFLELVDLSIIQPLESSVLSSESYEEKGTNVVCQVNAFFHEYIISRQMEDNLVFALDGHCSLNSQHAGQHLTIRSSWDRDEVVFRGIDVSRLRSLTVFGNWKSFLISEKMRLVRVLDLEEATDVTNKDLEHIGKLLPRLKFLSLRGQEEISLLPESLFGLRQLQTLDVRGTSVVTLPLGITKLQKLQYIRAGIILRKDEGDDTVASSQTADVDRISTPVENTAGVQEGVSDGVRTSTTSSWSRPQTLVSIWLSKFQKPRHGNGSVKVPAGIENLTALHTLGVVNVAAGKAALKELKNLTQLRKLGVSDINREHWRDFCLVISGYAHLESLSVRVDKDKDGLFARFGDISEPPKTLKSLKAYGHVQICPVWLLQLHNIRKVNFGLSILTQQDIDELDLYMLDITNGYIHMFRVLEIDCTSRLELSFGEEDGRVEKLKIQCSSGSSLQISLLENLGNLKEVWLRGFYDDNLKQDLERQLSSHPSKPVLKLEERRSS